MYLFKKEVQIFNTILLTPVNKRVIIPNGAVSNGSIINYSTEGILRVDLVIGKAYESGIPRPRRFCTRQWLTMNLFWRILASQVAVSELADSSVNLVASPWCKAADYWQVYLHITEAAKAGLEADGIAIPLPQRDVHIYEQLAAL